MVLDDALERENRELRQANEIPRKTSAYFARSGARAPTLVMIAFSDDHRRAYGVEPPHDPEPLQEAAPGNILGQFVDRNAGFDPPDIRLTEHRMTLQARSLRGNATSYTFSLAGVTAASRMLERCNAEATQS